MRFGEDRIHPYGLHFVRRQFDRQIIDAMGEEILHRACKEDKIACLVIPKKY